MTRSAAIRSAATLRLTLAVASALATGASPWAAGAEALPVKALSAATEPVGRPKIKLNRLSFPSIENSSYYKKRLERSLRREVQRADWGAGNGSVIEYRFTVDQLTLEADGEVLQVHCRATGELPAGKRASSSISFGGPVGKKRELVAKVLAIVARGVITRLADIERRRRAGS